jgi:hypothetical protein
VAGVVREENAGRAAAWVACGMRALVAGWFSFEFMGGTAGDLLACDVVSGWLREAECPYDVAVTEALGTGVDWRAVDPADYTHVIFVCGPLGNGEPATTLFQRFAHARLLGVDLSMLHPVDDWNPFAVLLERDSDRAARPDIAILAERPAVPLVGVVLVHEQKEYARGRHREVHSAIEAAVEGLDVAAVRIDTCLDPPNTTGFRTPGQIETAISRMDVIVTTRLHGLVLGLKHGIPVVAVDPIEGGAKIARQATTLGWPHTLTPDRVTPAAIRSQLLTCLSAEARVLARRCRDDARVSLTGTRIEFIQAVRAGGEG